MPPYISHSYRRSPRAPSKGRPDGAWMLLSHHVPAAAAYLPAGSRGLSRRQAPSLQRWEGAWTHGVPWHRALVQLLIAIDPLMLLPEGIDG